MPRILIVDDENDLADYLAGELKMAGFATSTASNGVEAVLQVLDGGWDGVVMDIRMPKLDGINALRIIRRIAPRLPVIMFTGQAGQGDMLESTHLGAFTCLAKPLMIDKLTSALNQALTSAAPR
ncbi:MAG TPA: response regulator [Anaerolineales bacterium]|nr:response regulator [Anaerolineales bacterium]